MHACLSDIHGVGNTLIRLLNRLPKGTNLIFLGDLIDRGPNSRVVVELAIKGRVPTCKGNHTDLCLAYSDHTKRGYKAKCSSYYERDVWLYNGGEHTLGNWPTKKDGHQVGNKIPKRVLDWMQSLPAYIKPDAPPDANGLRLLASHTGYGLDADLDTQDGWFRALWGRHPDDGEFPEDGHYRVFGHSRVKEAVVTDRFANIDTGAAYPGYGVLSALMWPSKEVITQQFDESPVRADFVLKDGCIV